MTRQYYPRSDSGYGFIKWK